MLRVICLSGMWQGAFAWSGVARALQARGIGQIEAIDLPGLARDDDQDGAAERFSMSCHLDHVLSRLAGRRDWLLCAHSYGGQIALRAADRHPDWFGAILMLDCHWPADGVSVLDGYAPAQSAAIRARAVNGWLAPPDPTRLGLDAVEHADFLRQLRPHPMASLRQALPLGRGYRAVPRKLAVSAQHGPRGADMAGQSQAAAARGFRHQVAAGGHQLMQDCPALVADLIADLARD